MSKFNVKIRQRIFFMIIILLIIILINYSFGNKFSSNEYENISNKLIMNRLKSHSRFFDESSSSCNLIGQLDFDKMQHLDRIAQALKEFREKIKPTYPENYFHSRGIVLTLGDRQIPLTKVNLKMIERTKTRLPIQIWYSSSELSEDMVTELLYYTPNLNISACSFTTSRCRTILKTWNLNADYVFPPPSKQNKNDKHFPSKPAAIISATFAEVLFLDSDSYLVRDPEYLFQSDPMYLQFGALFFPDALISGQHSVIWYLLNTTCGHNEVELDSGALLVDKRRVWNALYITKLMNDRPEIFYDGFSVGDKDTFRLAFRFLHVKYYIVGIPCSMGHFNGTYFCGSSMCKTDSLGRHIYINHVSLMKYVDAGYLSSNFDYTRIGLGDPYNHSFYMQFCDFKKGLACLLIDAEVNQTRVINRCIRRQIDLSEIDNRSYGLDEPFMLEPLHNPRILMSKTDNLMPGFIDSLFYYRRQVYGDKWRQSREE